MAKIDLSAVPVKTGSIYPEPYAGMMRGRSSLRLGDAGGLTQFGVNIVRLEAGALSSLRHWHLNEEEVVRVTAGECVLGPHAGWHERCAAAQRDGAGDAHPRRPARRAGGPR